MLTGSEAAPRARSQRRSGSASQSHFVKVFRQFTGVTPKQYKAGF